MSHDEETKNKVELKFTPYLDLDGNFTIREEVNYPLVDIMGQIIEHRIKTLDKMAGDWLISQGWTPPQSWLDKHNPTPNK